MFLCVCVFCFFNLISKGLKAASNVLIVAHAINVTDKFTLEKKAVSVLKACTDKPTAQAVQMKPPSQAIIKFFFFFKKKGF